MKILIFKFTYNHSVPVLNWAHFMEIVQFHFFDIKNLQDPIRKLYYRKHKQHYLCC